ncbi:AI-2E family transporter [Vampirovibrio sp.]|uniref:AI-2E family transporter n=1 Tax=Vampirovibrio sp. TaxID=2717857 RepID=UPI003593F54C
MESFKQKTVWLIGLVLVLWLLYMAQEALVVIFVAFIFASALLPLVEWLDRKLPRWLAVLIPYLILVGLFVGIIFPVGAITWQQFNLFIKDLPHYLDGMRDWAGQWTFMSKRYPLLTRFSPDLLIQQLSSQNTLFLSGFTGVTRLVSQLGLDFLSALIISLLLLMDREKIEGYFLQFQPKERHARIQALMDHLIRSTGGFVSGQLMFMASFGLLITLGLYIIGGPFPPFAVLLGALSGLLTLIPILGPNIAMAAALVIALFSPVGWVGALWVLVLFIAVQALANNIIGPLIMGRAVGLHPLAILLSLMIGGFVFGLLGLVLAIPVVTCLNIILEEWFIAPQHRASKTLLNH